MEYSVRSPGDDTMTDPKPVRQGCQRCRLGVKAAMWLLTVFLVTVSLLTLAFLIIKTTAPGIHNTAKESGKEAAEPTVYLYQCHADLQRVTATLHRITQDTRCRLCPAHWLWRSGHCYFFSVGLEEDRTWWDSAEFCQRHNASLALIEDRVEMELIQEVMRGFPRPPFLWVGLTDTQEEGHWVWWDRREHQLPINPGTEVEWNSERWDCADLRGDGSLFAADCQDYGPWVCERGAGGLADLPLAYHRTP